MSIVKVLFAKWRSIKSDYLWERAQELRALSRANLREALAMEEAAQELWDSIAEQQQEGFNFGEEVDHG